MGRTNEPLRKARQSAVYKLTLLGYKQSSIPMRRLVEFIELETGFKVRPAEDQTEFLRRFVAIRVKPVENPRTAGRRYTPPFREYKPTPHLRQAEIDAAPRQISMGGVGNGMQTWHGWGQ